MILGEEEADIPTYFNDDEPRKRKKERLFAGSDYFAQLKNQGAIARNFTLNAYLPPLFCFCITSTAHPFSQNGGYAWNTPQWLYPNPYRKIRGTFYRKNTTLHTPLVTASS